MIFVEYFDHSLEVSEVTENSRPSYRLAFFVKPQWPVVQCVTIVLSYVCKDHQENAPLFKGKGRSTLDRFISSS